MSQYLGFARKIILVRERGRGFLLYLSVNYLILIPCFFRNIKVISYKLYVHLLWETSYAN